MSEELRELGKRLRARRTEAQMDVDTLAHRSGVKAAELRSFEAGRGGLGIAALGRLSAVLGIDAAAFVHVDAARQSAPPPPSVLLSQAGNSSLSADDRRRIESSLLRARSFCSLAAALGLADLSDKFNPMAPPQKKPYEAGYRLAGRVRHEMKAPGGPLRDLAQTIEDDFNTLVVRLPFDDPAIQGASCRSGSARLIVVNAALREEVARFVLGHELCHQLSDLKENEATTDRESSEGSGFDLEHTPKEQRARAFAAMLLAPKESVRDLLGAPGAASLGMEAAVRMAERACRHFGLSFAATAWHLMNLLYIGKDEAFVRRMIGFADRVIVGGFERAEHEDGLDRRLRVAREHDVISAARERELLVDRAA